jgi:hypothetical protein
MDITSVPSGFEGHVKEHFGFWDAHFSGHPEGYRHFEPNRHLTLKLGTKEEFQRTYDKLKQRIESIGAVGYIEGELVISDVPIPFKAHNDNVPLPFRVERRLLSGAPNEAFRETEFHLVLDKDSSDPRLIKKLLDAGLYGAYIQKRDHIALVLTMQGHRDEIDSLAGMLYTYLHESGGAARCTLQEERAIAYHLFGIDHTKLPEIAAKVDYLSDDMRQMGAEAVRKMRANGRAQPEPRSKLTR